MASTALIVGASRGLGLGLSAEYRRRGWQVIGTARDEAGTDLHDLAAADDGIEIETLDITDEGASAALERRLGGRSLDLLFVNAGISLGWSTPIGEVAEADFRRIMLVNCFAPLRIIDRLAARVAADGTIAVMSSGLGSIAGSDGGYEIYRMSKAALNMGLKSLAKRRADSRTYLCVSPGWVRTDMGGAHATLSVEQSVSGIADMIGRRAGRGGAAFVNHDDKEMPW